MSKHLLIDAVLTKTPDTLEVISHKVGATFINDSLTGNLTIDTDNVCHLKDIGKMKAMQVDGKHQILPTYNHHRDTLHTKPYNDNPYEV